MDIHSGTANLNFFSRPPAKGQIINAGKNPRSTKTQVIDGFVKRPAASAPLKSKTLRPAQAVAQELHRRSEKGSTLMRGALKKPSISNRVQNLRPGSNAQREFRAQQTVKHSMVERFGGYVASAKAAEKTNKEPLLSGELMAPAAPRPKSQASSAVALPSMITSASHAKLERMLDTALTRADAHKQALKYQAARHFWQKPGFLGRHRWTKLSVLLVVVLAATFFAAWQKIPQLSLKVASMRAHLSAAAPAYKPEGYDLAGPAAVKNRAVTLQYASSLDKSKAYTVEEQPSNQDSSSLIANNSSPSQQVQTAQSNGVPIIIIQNRVMCVSNGLQTTITNKASLTPDELLNIAKSICG